jgi:hypothetical protein
MVIFVGSMGLLRNAFLHLHASEVCFIHDLSLRYLNRFHCWKG